MPAEERRLNTAVFREGLKKRGLRDILELHLKDYPPQSGAEQLLLEREARLSEFRDARLPLPERMAALQQANAALDRLIRENPEDQRRFQWMYELAHSLIFEEGAPYATSILYTGGSAEDRAKLAHISASALKATRTLIERLEAEFARIDGLTAGQFARIENSQYMADLDRIAPNADYLLLWALFYDSLPRDPDDQTRQAQLNEILSHMARDPLILKASQEQTHVQIPATVLAGATYRHLGDYHNARQFLDRARSLWDRLADDKEKLAVQWAVVLADIEGIRADRDDGRWPGAMERLAALRERIDAVDQAQSVDTFPLRLSAALLERSVNVMRAEAVEKAGRPEEAAEVRRAAWQAVAGLAAAYPDRRDELFAAVERAADASVPPEGRDPVQMVAHIASLLSDPGGRGITEDSLAQTIGLAEHFLDNRADEAQALTPQVLRYLGVAQYRSGDAAAAAGSFTKLACSYPNHPDARQSAVYAVQLAAKLHQQKAEGAQAPYRAALECLLNKFAETEHAGYWRFFYGQLLEEMGEHDSAAAQYALVESEHEQYLESAFLRVRSLGVALQRFAESSAEASPAALAERADAMVAANRELLARGRKLEESSEGGFSRVQALLAEGALLTAEAVSLPGVARYRYAIDLLSDFEAKYPAQAALAGRVWRVRLGSYFAMGDAYRFAESITNYVNADPHGAGRTLQALYNAAAASHRQSAQLQGAEQAAEKAKTALLLAEKIASWADKHGQSLSAQEKRYVFAQLAEANLEAGEYEKARGQFATVLPPAGSQLPQAELDLRIMLGHARALAAVGNCAEALPEFNQLATGLAPPSPLRWEALLGDLSCRTALGEPAAGIIKVIEQQKLLYPDLGGPAFQGRFEIIRRENERR